MKSGNGSLLDLKEFHVSFAGKKILQGINLSLQETGINVLMGPSGTGKSTLARTLAGINDANPSMHTSGTARYLGHPLGDHQLPSLVSQKAQLMMATVRENIVAELPERSSLSVAQQCDIASRMLASCGLTHLQGQLDKKAVELDLGEQRLLAIARTTASNPRLLIIDEATSGLTDEAALRIIDYLIAQSRNRAVLIIVHNQIHAKKLGGNLYLMAGGLIVEEAETQRFFETPETELGKAFVRTGSCCPPSGTATYDTDDHKKIPSRMTARKVRSTTSMRAEMASTHTIMTPDPQQVLSDCYGPRNFLWLIKGAVAGTPRPGIYQDLEFDLHALQRVGVTVLVCLEKEAPPVSESELKKFNMSGISFPIEDMGAPDIDGTLRLIDRVIALVKSGERVAFHCKAGIGRTGTLLVSYLIREGESALSALEFARSIEPRWVQSDHQIEFLEKFHALCKQNPVSQMTVLSHP